MALILKQPQNCLYSMISLTRTGGRETLMHKDKRNDNPEYTAPLPEVHGVLVDFFVHPLCLPLLRAPCPAR